MYLFSVYLKSVYLQHPSGRCQTVLPQPGGSLLWRVKDSRGEQQEGAEDIITARNSPAAFTWMGESTLRWPKFSRPE